MGTEGNAISDSGPVFVCPHAMGNARGRLDEGGDDPPEPAIRRRTREITEMQLGILKRPQPQVNGGKEDRNATERIENNAGHR